MTTRELRAGRRARQPRGLTSWRGAFQYADRVLHGYERHAFPPLRRQALRRGAEWIVARQEKDGSWGGIQPPWVYSLMALHALGYPLDHPVLAAGLRGMGPVHRTDRRSRRPAAPDRGVPVAGLGHRARAGRVG